MLAGHCSGAVVILQGHIRLEMCNFWGLLVVVPSEIQRLSSGGNGIVNTARVAVDAHLPDKRPVVDAFELQLRLMPHHSFERHR